MPPLIANDDLTLMTNGEILSPALDQLKQSAASIQYIYGIKKSLPTTASGAKALASINDPWGRPLRYTLISSNSARISSDGPDQTHKTRMGPRHHLERQTKHHRGTRNLATTREKTPRHVGSSPS